MGHSNPGGYYNEIPAPGWTLKVVGSSNIPLYAIVASYHYDGGAMRAKATALLNEYYEAASLRGMFCLKEPGSTIYGGATFGAWVWAVVLARKYGDAALAARFMDLCRQWLAMNAAMLAPVKEEGRPCVAMAGCRSWGHGDGTYAMLHHFTRVAMGLEKQAGADWPNRANWSSNPLWTAVAKQAWAEAKAAPDLWANVRFGTYVPMSFYWWDDGSRCSTLGHDEPELDSEFGGISTLGIHLSRITAAGVMETYPEYPAPNSGDTHIRMQSSKVDLDGGPLTGWTLRHSMIGRVYDKTTERWITDIPLHTKAKLTCWKVLDEDGLHDMLAATKPEPQPTPPPVVDTSGQGRGQQDGGGCFLAGLLPKGKK